MLKRTISVLLCSSVLFGCSASLQKERDPERGEEQIRSVHPDLEFKDSEKIIFNPDMGFYSVVKAIVTKDNITIKSSYKNRLEVYLSSPSRVYCKGCKRLRPQRTACHHWKYRPNKS